MAITVMTPIAASHFTRPTGPGPISSGSLEVECCMVTAEPAAGSTYVQADDATLTAAALIQNTKRDGKTVTVVGCAPCAAGLDSAGVVYFAGQPTIAASVATFPLTTANLSAERAGAAIDPGVRPMCFCVTYTQAA